MSNRTTKTKELSMTKAQIEHYDFIKAKEAFEMKNHEGDEASKYLIQTLVIRFNDITDKEGIYNSVMDLPMQDYQEVQDSLMSILDAIKAKKD